MTVLFVFVTKDATVFPSSTIAPTHPQSPAASETTITAIAPTTKITTIAPPPTKRTPTPRGFTYYYNLIP